MNGDPLTVARPAANLAAVADITRDSDIGLVRLVTDARRAGSIVQDAFDIACPWHHHDMHQLQYAFEGTIELEDGARRYLLPPSLAGWIPAGVTHRDSMHRVRSLSLLLPRDAVPGDADRIRIVRVPPLMRAMLAEAVRWPVGTDQDATGTAFFAAFRLLCREWIEDEAPFTLPTSPDASVTAAMVYARQTLASATMAGACRAAAATERTLRRRFRQSAGMSWDQYLRQARLLAAVEQLIDSDRSIAWIAADVGYENQSAFAKAFTALMGEAPQAFRRRTREHDPRH